MTNETLLSNQPEEVEKRYPSMSKDEVDAYLIGALVKVVLENTEWESGYSISFYRGKEGYEVNCYYNSVDLGKSCWDSGTNGKTLREAVLAEV